MWLIYDDTSGAQVGDWRAEQPAPPAGQSAVRVPGSAKSGVTVWDAEARGFVDALVLDYLGIWNLFTGSEKTAICLSSIPEVGALVKALPFVTAMRPTDVQHQQGIALLAGLGLLTPARAAEVLAFQRPSQP